MFNAIIIPHIRAARLLGGAKNLIAHDHGKYVLSVVIDTYPDP